MKKGEPPNVFPPQGAVGKGGDVFKSTGMKFDEDKLRYDLMPPHALEGVVRILTFGAAKYAPNNWQKVEKERYVAAAMRHLEAYRKGEMMDEETGQPHMYHAMCCLTFISEIDRMKSSVELVELDPQLGTY